MTRLDFPRLIAKKRQDLEHTPEELRFIAHAATNGGVPDYQLSAWLMAVVLRGMTPAETAGLTRAMADSGRRLRRLGLRRAPWVDKHSTGGVGDGVSLALAPLAAAAGLVVPMMSGRSLGHTGGTLDKLESIPGFRVGLSLAEIERQLRRIGVAMFGQTREIAPSDRKLYALRDATSTVDSLPLIVSSILSKKLAEGLDGLVLDVKFGSGAILSDPRKSLELGRALVKTSKSLGLKCVGLWTDMEEPLGLAVGNALEMRQAVRVLHGDLGGSDYVELLLALGGWMLVLGGRARAWEEGARRMEKLLKEGAALRKFKEMVRAQGGDVRVAEDPSRHLPAARCVRVVRSPASGYLTGLDARRVAEAASLLGTKVDPGAGILLEAKVGSRVARGSVLARLYGPGEPEAGRAEKAYLSAVRIGARPPKRTPLIRKVLR